MLQCRADCRCDQAGQDGALVADLIRHLGIAGQTFYQGKRWYAGLEAEQVRQFNPPSTRNYYHGPVTK